MKTTQLPPLSPAPLDKLYHFKTQKSWGVKDPEKFDRLMGEAAGLVLGGSYLSDNLFTWMRNISALDDVAFKNAWESNLTSQTDEAIMWRRYILCCAAYHCVHLEGDFVECGVLNGTGMKTVIDYFGKDKFGKTFWGYDSFDVLPDGQPAGDKKSALMDFFHSRFVGYEGIRLVPGMLPESFAEGCPERIAYLHIDLNHAASEIAVLEHLFDKVVPGGVIILDDYEWSGAYRDQKIAEDAWFDARQYRVFPLPTGQGLVLKRGPSRL